ncbi:MAG: carbamoyl phosphate synthase small subunit [Phycisphaerae bacterium]|nr:carbamoyl phosphate synthase small subunit [Phycisphaerae bacterium]MBM90330.1 carbamoyl phosphate synthase small subunit [Phycisphaerae bacterium]HCT45579.1 carbamoyl phosphate synthase small subunit [Phycisphaerales bacterium]
MSEHTHAERQKPAARLALSSGQIYSGAPFGAIGRDLISTGELVFNTAMCGYQESLTDPSYMGQILIQTQPLIGNTGVNPEDTESEKVQVAGFVIHEFTEHASNFRLNQRLDAYLADAGVLGIAGLDTRALTRTLRTGGVVQAVLTDRTDLSDSQLVEMARQVHSMSGQNLAAIAGKSDASEWTEGLGSWVMGPDSDDEGDAPSVLLFDFGVKSNIPRNLTQRGARVKLVPQSTNAAQIKQLFLDEEIQGVFLSNGPGDPEAVQEVVETLKELLADPDLVSMPIFGICLGHQLLCLALGAKTFKLPFGHRGANHPVHDVEAGRVQITSQNHGFAVDPDSICEAGGVITHLHLNDGTVAGFRHQARPIYSVQFHPEASPGPHDASGFFDLFMALIKDRVKSSVGDTAAYRTRGQK